MSYWPFGIGAARHSKTGVFSAGKVIKHPVDVPSGTGPGLPRQRFESRRQIVFRRQRRVQLVVDDYGLQCPLLGLQLPWGQPAGPPLPCERSSVALPPGIGMPLGTRTGLGGRENSALRPPPEALCAWAHRPRDSASREKLSPRLGPFLRPLPPRKGGRPTPPSAEGRYFSLTLERPPLATAEKQALLNPAASKASVLFSPRHKPRP